MKSKTTALILSILVGGLGTDRFYLGYTGMGVLKLLTAGCFGILYIIDIVNIATGKLLPADGTPYDDDTKSVPIQSQQTVTPYDELENSGIYIKQAYYLTKSLLKQKGIVFPKCNFRREVFRNGKQDNKIYCNNLLCDYCNIGYY